MCLLTTSWGAYSAVQSLLKREPERIVFVGDFNSSMSFEERKRGYVQAINDYMLKENKPIDVQYVSGMGVSGNGNYLSTEFEEQLEAVVKNNVNGISLFCANDMIALEVLSALNKWNIPCPSEASVIGFDNLPYCDLAQPKLSSVIVPIVDIGVRAAQLMIRRIEQPSVLPEHVMLVTKLIIRESSSYPTE